MDYRKNRLVEINKNLSILNMEEFAKFHHQALEQIKTFLNANNMTDVIIEDFWLYYPKETGALNVKLIDGSISIEKYPELQDKMIDIFNSALTNL